MYSQLNEIYNTQLSRRKGVKDHFSKVIDSQQRLSQQNRYYVMADAS